MTGQPMVLGRTVQCFSALETYIKKITTTMLMSTMMRRKLLMMMKKHH